MGERRYEAAFSLPILEEITAGKRVLSREPKYEHVYLRAHWLKNVEYQRITSLSICMNDP